MNANGQTPEARAAYERAYLTDPANVAKRKARDAINQRIRSGKVTRQPCEACGAAKAHAHHEDYSKPLEVIWLCSLHHRQVHLRGLDHVLKHRA